MADSEHGATGGDQGGGAEVELLGAKNGRHHNVSSGLDSAVGAQHNPRAQVVEHQGLLRFGDAKLKRHAGMFDRTLRRSSGASIMSADENHVRIGFGHAGGHGADARAGN